MVQNKTQTSLVVIISSTPHAAMRHGKEKLLNHGGIEKIISANSIIISFISQLELGRFRL
jgi:hypothetical protein